MSHDTQEQKPITKEELLEAKKQIADHVGNETAHLTIAYWLKFLRDLAFAPHFNMNYPGPKRNWDYGVDGIIINLQHIQNIGVHCCDYVGTMWTLPQASVPTPDANLIESFENRSAFEGVWNRYTRALVEIESINRGIDAKLQASLRKKPARQQTVSAPPTVSELKTGSQHE